MAAGAWQRLTTSVVLQVLLLSLPQDLHFEGGRPSWPRGRSGVLLATAQIEQCHAECSKCHLFDFDLSWHCLECNPGFDLWVDGCFLPCPAGQYRYGYDCLECVRECNRGRYAPANDRTRCDECDAYCRECIAGTRISCSSCYSGYTLRILDANTNTGRHCIDCNSLYNCFECETGATLFRGICYLIPTGTVDSTVDFQEYLSSGAGATWDPNDAPSWQLLVAQARLRPELAGKLTGMMLELPNAEILELLESEAKLKHKIDEAVQVLDKQKK
ncbi:Polyadenylate-binding protein, cytoplasmic and nuclear [Symbiodinium microadriaticum]|uniref:Polyadenylate-binding protein, cytoplasmic and nuclear n=1 Tax=Symbiodinium microadriaticum TaxID=2951 RepID=A0A1Q9ERM1_SYMMI|nr:Polyadenylate-binding protein, cytoplasmic and nuclear [Symbiodinium microadriaticum]